MKYKPKYKKGDYITLYGKYDNIIFIEQIIGMNVIEQQYQLKVLYANHESRYTHLGMTYRIAMRTIDYNSSVKPTSKVEKVLFTSI